jgi:hypothetical protein
VLISFLDFGDTAEKAKDTLTMRRAFGHARPAEPTKVSPLPLRFSSD